MKKPLMLCLFILFLPFSAVCEELTPEQSVHEIKARLDKLSPIMM